MKAEDVNPTITQETAKSGSEPEIKIADVMDAALADSSEADDKDVKDKDIDPSDDGKRPWHEDPRFKKDLHLLKAARNLMELNDLDSIEELADYVDKGKTVKGKKVDVSKLDDIVAKAERLDKYEAYWAQQKELQKRQEEDPDQTIQRLEQKLREVEHKDKAKEQAERASLEAKESIKFYERTVSDLIEDNEDIPKDQHKFISLVMGISNPSNDIDITDRKAIKKTYNEILKSVKEFADAMKQQGASEYRKGKLEIPKVATTSPSAPVTEKKHNLKTARAALMEAFMGKSG